jgi:hypothetical protein
MAARRTAARVSKILAKLAIVNHFYYSSIANQCVVGNVLGCSEAKRVPKGTSDSEPTPARDALQVDFTQNRLTGEWIDR